MKILLHATHPSQKTGYGSIGRFLANTLARANEIVYLGYEAANIDNDPAIYGLNPGIVIRHITDPASDGFGYRDLESLAESFKPDIIFISNDIIVLNQALSYLHVVNRTYKLVSYLAIEYPHPNKSFTKTVHDFSDLVLFYNDYWKHHVADFLGVGYEKLGTLRIPYSLPVIEYIPIKRGFVVLNTNRNVYRKLLDITVSAFIMFWKMTGCDPNVKLILNCNNVQDTCYNFRDIIATESYRHFNNKLIDIPIENFGSGLSEEALMELYKMSSVGINTAGGEGFGMTQMEGACIGVPQIVNNVGGLSDMFTNEELSHFPNCYVKIEPVAPMYIPFKTENIQGLFRVPRAEDFANALYNVYRNYPGREELEIYKAAALSKYNIGGLENVLINSLGKLYGGDSVIFNIGDTLKLKDLIDNIVQKVYSEGMNSIVFAFADGVSVRLDRVKLRSLLSRFINGNLGYKQDYTDVTITGEDVKSYML